jgi:uncharacterized protein YuzE
MLRIESDQKADALYIHFSDKPVKSTKEITPDIAMDFAEDGTPVGIDFQRFSELVAETAASNRGKRLPTSPAAPAGVSFELVGAL